MMILGISAFYHDSAAALVQDGEIIAAAQEERFTRKKHDARFPENAIRYCLRGRRRRREVITLAYYESLRVDRLLETYLAFAPKGFPLSEACPCENENCSSATCSRKSSASRSPLGAAGKLLFSSIIFLMPPPPSILALPAVAVLTMDGVGE
jgi:carbamoyltransferase